MISQAYEKAVEVLRHCARPKGFYASGLLGGYEAVWARDSMITSLGASLVGNEFEKPFRRSLETLAKHQSDLGQIPNCVGSYNLDRQSDVTFNSIDSTLWFIIGHYVYALAFDTTKMLQAQQKNIARAIVWLSFQDPNEDKLLAQQPTMDWQDAFPHKYGRTINTHALYYAALRFINHNKLAEYIKSIINGQTQKYLSLYSPRLGYYLPWAWKNHDGDLEHEEWFDSLGNILAIITGLATPTIARRILCYIEKEKINEPAPCKAIWPPIKRGDKEWHSYFSKCDARQPYHYLNAGIWPFIGGFYVAALVKAKQFKKAEAALKKLAAANLKIIKNPDSPDFIIATDKRKTFTATELKKIRQKEFNEWLHGRTGKPMGEPYQAWNAGTYIYAYACVKQRKVIFFD